MKHLFLLAAFIVLASAYNLEKEWKMFKLKYRKTYHNSSEELRRKMYFAENLKIIEEHNAQYEIEIKKSDPEFTYTVGITFLADLSEEEFLNKYSYPSDRDLQINGSISQGPPHKNIVKKNKGNDKDKNKNKKKDNMESKAHVPIKTSLTEEFTNEMSWAQKYPQIPILDQGECGGCWAFATVGAVEYHLAEKNPNGFVKYSEQELIDCLKSPDNRKRGCSGGFPTEAFQYIIQNGITPAQYYPNLIPFRDGICIKDKVQVELKAKITAFRRLTTPDEEELKKIIAFKGPAVATITVTPKMQIYDIKKGEVFYDEKMCRKYKYNKHTVIIVGYGVDPNSEKNHREYWLIKNSYGPNWGLNGYLKLARNKKSHCGVASEVYYPEVE